VGTPQTRALRIRSDARARAVIELAFQRTGPTAVAARVGLSRSVVRGWAEEGGLALTLRDVLLTPQPFARDVLTGVLALVTEDVPDHLGGLERMASRLVCAAAELLQLAEEAPTDTTRRLILALVDRVEQLAQQIRRKVLGTKREG
jgi:hypothetical protein